MSACPALWEAGLSNDPAYPATRHFWLELIPPSTVLVVLVSVDALRRLGDRRSRSALPLR